MDTKLSNRLLTAATFSASVGVSLVAWVAFVPTHHGGNQLDYQLPAAATATTSSPTPSLSPSATISSPMIAPTQKVVRKMQAAPADITDPSTVPSTTDSSPSPSGTALATSDAPATTDPATIDPQPDDGIHGPMTVAPTDTPAHTTQAPPPPLHPLSPTGVPNG